MKEAFKVINFKGSSKVMIDRANAILAEYRAAGYYNLTLRQLYYQLVARDVIPNNMKSYKRLGSIVNDARLAGKIDWNAIQDRTRNLQSVGHWQEPSEIIRSAAESFRIDKWQDQEYRVEVWVEKDAMIGVLERACCELDCAWFSCRGYTSQSELYGAGKRLSRYRFKDRQIPVIIHLGDHDPSGIDMTRDILDRMAMFCGFDVEVKRIALNMDQIVEYAPPPNPAKVTDSRFDAYAQEHGEESWELDALDMRVVHDLIQDTVKELRDEDKWQAQVKDEEKKRQLLSLNADKWSKVVELLEGFEEENRDNTNED